MQRIAIGLIIAGSLTALCLVILIPWESGFLENQINVSPIAGTRQQIWLTEFQDVAVSQVLTALGFTLLWLGIGFGYYRIKDWKTAASGRLIWSLLLTALVLFVALIGWFYTPATQGDPGKIVAVIAYVLNALLIFYVTSILSSPTSVKYAPLGAVAVGRSIRW